MNILMRAALPFLFLLPGWSHADSPTVGAFENVATDSGIPRVVLYAIACAETNQHSDKEVSGPWPWTLTIAGERKRYSSREDAEAALEDALRLGITNIGIGLMQINWRLYHGRLASPARALDPEYNLRVGASILKAEWRRSGDLWLAIGRFHSRSPQEANAFQEHVGAEVVRLLTRQTPDSRGPAGPSVQSG